MLLKKKSLNVEVNDQKIGQAVPFHQFEETILEDLLRIVRIAALVHDLGHGPFSHTFDEFAPKAEQISKLIEKDNKLKCLKKLGDLLGEDKSENARVEHEDMSCVLFAIIWSEIKKNNDRKVGHHFQDDELPQIISSIILGKSGLSNNTVLANFIPLLHDLVASAPIDADRMDYMERDSRSIGVSYGIYDKERLLKSMLVYQDESQDNSSSHSYRLGIKLSGIRAVENFIQARFELFVQIYYHKTNRAIEIMFNEIGKLASKERADLFRIDTSEDIVKIYTDLSDAKFLMILQDLDSQYTIEKFENRDKIAVLAQKIASRKLWKKVFEGDYEMIKKMCESLKGGLTDDTVIRPDKINPKATKDLENGAALLERNEYGFYATDKNSSQGWQEGSLMIDALAKEENMIGRIYYVGEDIKELDDLRNNARKFTLDSLTKTEL